MCYVDLDEVWGLLQSGSRNRSVGSTNANELSSRSHCLLRVTVKGENLVNGERTSSHLWLVDLAGSERVGRMKLKELQAHSYSTKLSSWISCPANSLAPDYNVPLHCTYLKCSGGHYELHGKFQGLAAGNPRGDCKTLMFVQISPSAADLGETLCSLNFASRVRGIGCGPVRKQADLTELFKYKATAEKLKHEEKETKKLQDVCRSLQEKVIIITYGKENQIKTTPEDHCREEAAFGPSKLKMPLKEISNFLPPPSPIPPHKTMSYSSILPASTDNKENMLRPSAAATKTKSLLQPRRTIAKTSHLWSKHARPTAAATNTKSFCNQDGPPFLSDFLKHQQHRFFQPKRRVSIESLLPEFNSHMITPLTAELKSRGAMGSRSFVRNPYRIQRISRIFSPLPGSEDSIRCNSAGNTNCHEEL
ncbi:Kinesin-like protein KIN-14S [Vitis vinifera]|uniref:Kinesin-like protein n=1 Tax=Vitis vinifera TaxID=29760 RepID=A0A438KD22_VITVI|nr:Kinesin-like protein KIN-14S [Vitis vinifera]